MDYYGNNNDMGENRDQDPFAPGYYQPGPSNPGSCGEPGFTGFHDGPSGPEKPKKPRKNRTAWKVVALCLVCAVIGASIHPLYELASGGNNTTLYVGDRQPTQLNLTAVDTEKEMTTAEIYAAYVGSTVGITVDIVSTNIFGQTVTGAAAGSGFVITEDGYILTNYHVIADANSITVAFVDGTTYPATYVGGEEANDIAVIKINATGLTPVVIGSSDDMLVGEQVTAIGNPLGELTFTETTGIISALNRSITMSDGSQLFFETLIIATGASAKYLGLESESKFRGMGVSACATCDGFFYRDRTVAVVGGGDSACEEALYLSGLARKVYMIVRKDYLRASEAMKSRVMSTANIEVLFGCSTREILGDALGVTGARLARENGEIFEIKIDGFFLAIGRHPNTEWLGGGLALTQDGYIKSEGVKTEVEGVFVAGDVRNTDFRQAITAAADGCRAALEAEKYIKNKF